MTTARKTFHSYVVNTALASCALFFGLLHLNAADRTGIEYAVVSLVAVGVVWNLVTLTRRFYQLGGGRAVWHLHRTVLFWTIGLLNTALLRPEHVGGWKHWLGWALVVLAVIDTVALFRIEKRGAQS